MRARSQLFAISILVVTAAGAWLACGQTGGAASIDDAGSSDASQPDSAISISPTDSSVGDETSAEASADAGCPGCARDWNAAPPIAVLDGVSEIYAASDFHGDYAATTKLLAAAHLASAAPASPALATWTGGTAALVVVGDMIDKGPDAPDVLRFLAALRVSAAAAGGHVIVTMGNHEAEFLADPANSKATGPDGFDLELEDGGLSPDATASGADDVGLFIRDLPFAARVDDWFFVHGGKTDGYSIADLSQSLRVGVDTQGFGAPILAADDSMLEANLDDTGPEWWDATGNAQALLTSWTSALGVSHIVMGHQPGAVKIAGGADRNADQMFAVAGGLLFLVDTGMSVDVDDTGGAVLHVTGAGTATEAWSEIKADGTVIAVAP